MISQIPARCSFATSFGHVCVQDSVMEFGLYKINFRRNCTATKTCLLFHKQLVINWNINFDGLWQQQELKVIWHKAASPPQTDSSIVFARLRQYVYLHTVHYNWHPHCTSAVPWSVASSISTQTCLGFRHPLSWMPNFVNFDRTLIHIRHWNEKDQNVSL